MPSFHYAAVLGAAAIIITTTRVDPNNCRNDLCAMFTRNFIGRSVGNFENYFLTILLRLFPIEYVRYCQIVNNKIRSRNVFSVDISAGYDKCAKHFILI